MDEQGGADRDYESYRILVGLWAGENPVKTGKLLVLFLAQAILAAALVLAGGFTRGNWPVCLAGAALSLAWILSLGRTTLFQARWRQKIRELARRYPGDPRFQVLEPPAGRVDAPLIVRAAGSVPSAYYLVGAPVVSFLCWVVALVVLAG
ncbi:MAG TPA: hypothetical protein VMB35_08155 [Methanomicrobiales archaeon]|nr:hypothetical protein [Methanomicrobiales archaeon]